MLILRAHHIFCIQGYIGKGYSKDFVKNMDKVVNSLNPDALVKIVTEADDLCSKCPHMLKDHHCDSQAKISFLDASSLKTLTIKPNYIYKYRDLLDALNKNLTFKNFRETCAVCSWFSCGYCKNGLFKNKT
ncbi:MAG TPA: DUF1284 domain-containing protein [Clostridium sp.]|jgi:hypothetical protein|uniref:DUF1284 domain-containing protein n=1 Tax=Clostridium lapidicellarium TaxID=3240931 RepID=A0ABV4E1B1_9CLOT|nr:DUF1284 domain-containing protein [uncultured Clostridium sp.]NLU08812.1 DUF1284 domain-containing protein [Clostridiales bacterium]HBC96104.1 DUF1284 domain-containing protein [Clostridium sp.]